MLKAYVIVHRRPDLSWEAFARHWRDVHAPLALALPGLRRYAQLRVPAAFFGGETPCDGLAELWFDDADALRRAFNSPAGRRVLDDNARFVDLERTKLVVPEVGMVWPDDAARGDAGN